MSHPRHLRLLALGLMVTVGLSTRTDATWVKEYDSQEDETLIGGTRVDLSPWGEANGFGISSWYFIAEAPDAKIERVSLYVHNVAGMPNAYDWGYRIKIGPTTDTEITDDPDSQVSVYTTVHNGWNPATTLVAPGWHDVDLQTPYLMSSSSNYILKFEYLGDSNPLPNQDNYWLTTGDRLDHDCYAQIWGDGLTHRLDYLARVRLYGDRADLKAWILKVTPDALWSDQYVHFTLDYQNTSDAEVTEYYDVVLKYKGEHDLDWTTIDSPREVQGHPARQWKSLTWVWLPPSAGFYFFQVKLDVNDEVFETDEDNNELPWVAGSYRVKDRPSPPIKTLILTDSGMMVHRGYLQADVDDLMDDLDYLAANDPRGKGAVIDISDFSTDSDIIHTRDQQWDANMGVRLETKPGTNAYVDALDWLIEGRHHYEYPDLVRVIIVGSHEIIPMHVHTDEVGDGGYNEMNWSTNYDADTDMRLLYEVPAPGNYLTDAKYADLEWVDQSDESNLTRELAVGRLIETPTQISAIIDNYFAVNGLNPMDDIACIGSFEFKDGAYRAAAALSDYGYTVDTTLIGDSFASTQVPTKMEAKDDLIYIGGHGGMTSIATDAWRDASDILHVDDEFMAGDHASRGDTNDLDSLPTAVIVSAGCHNGTIMPNKTYHEPDPGGTQYHDYPEEFASTGAIAYLGATGYTWISYPDGGPNDTDTLWSEVLCSDIVDKFAQGWTIGQAHRRAANEYYLNNKDELDNVDRKVLGIHQIYGIPGYKRSSLSPPPPGGFHFGNTSIQQVGNTTFVQTTLFIDDFVAAEDGVIQIAGASYTGDNDTPVLPVIRYTGPDPVPPGSCLKRAHFYGSLSVYQDLPNVVPTAGMAQRDTYLPAEPFVSPDFYPEVTTTAFSILNEGGQDADIGLVIHPVQYFGIDPMTGSTRVWEQMVLELEYDTTQVSFHDSFAAGDLAKWTLTQLGAAGVELDHLNAASNPYCLRIIGASAAGDRVKVESTPINIDFTKPYRIELLFQYSSFHWDRFLIFGHIRLLLDEAHLPLLYDPVGDNSFVGNTVGPVFNSYAPPDTWMSVSVNVDPAVRQYNITINDTAVGTVTYQQTVVPSATIWFEDNGSDSNYLNAHYDDFRVMGTDPLVLLGDLDHDGDIDLDDYAELEPCLSGPGVAVAPVCVPCDLDGDGDCDVSDFAIFAANFTGSLP